MVGGRVYQGHSTLLIRNDVASKGRSLAAINHNDSVSSDLYHHAIVQRLIETVTCLTPSIKSRMTYGRVKTDSVAL